MGKSAANLFAEINQANGIGLFVAFPGPLIYTNVLYSRGLDVILFNPVPFSGFHTDIV